MKPQPTDPSAPGVGAADASAAEGGAASDIGTRTVRITFFPNEKAQTLVTADMTLPQLAEHIANQTAASKMELPWLKLAIFGNKRSEKNCLRTNDNVLQITGIEVEHDAGEISFDNAIATMRKAGIRSLLYTSPSYVPGDKERWRILLPLSKNHPPEMREKLVARINGLFGGKLAPESFTLSQAYLYGHVNNPDHRVEVVDGNFLDLRDDLYAGSIFKDGSRVGRWQGANGTTSTAPARNTSPARMTTRGRSTATRSRPRSTSSAAIALTKSGCVSAGALHHALGESGFELFDRWSAKATAKYTRR